MANVAKWSPQSKRNRTSTISRVPVTHWAIAATVVVLFSYIRWHFGVQRGDPALAWLAFVPFFIIFVITPELSSAVNRPTPELRKLRNKQSRKCYPVKMTVLKNDLPIGQDEGLVFLEGDELEYQGLLTAFHLTSKDVEAPKDLFASRSLLSQPDKQKFGNLLDRSAWGFVLNHNPDFRVFFYPLDSGIDSIYRPLFKWLQQPPAEDSGRTLPPLEPLEGYKPPAMFKS